MLVHQLAQVLVAAGDDDLDALARAHAGQRADDIVSLDARHTEHLPAHQLDHLVNGLDLAAQVVGHGRALGFVSRIKRIAKGRALGVKDTHRVISPHVLAQLLHHVDHAADGAGGRAGRIASHHPQVGHGVKSAVQVAGAVYQQQGLGIGGHVQRLSGI